MSLPFRITLRGRVDERMFHGPKLELYTELSTEPGTREFRVRDVVSNRGGEDQEFQMLYHINFGPPLLEDGSTFLAPLSQVTAFNEHAAKDVTRFDRYGPPTRGFIEQVYCLRPRADSEGNTLALIRNKAGNRGASIRFSTAELPYPDRLEEHRRQGRWLRHRHRAGNQLPQQPPRRAQIRPRPQTGARRQPHDDPRFRHPDQSRRGRRDHRPDRHDSRRRSSRSSI